MKDALVGFCGCLKMRKVLSSMMSPRMQTITILHASIRARASKARVRMTHSPTKHATAEEEKMNERDQFVDQKDEAKKMLAVKQEEQ